MQYLSFVLYLELVETTNHYFLSTTCKKSLAHAMSIAQFVLLKSVVPDSFY